MKKITLFLSLLFLSTILKAATFTSVVVTGNYSAPSSWSIAGADADGIPDNNDDVIISTGNTITLITTGFSRNLTISAGGAFNMNNNSILVYGSLTNNGSSTGSGSWQFRAAGTYTGNNLPNNGYIYFYANYVIAPGVVINKPGSIVVASYVNLTNNGTISLNSAGILHLYIGSTWINASGSSVSVSGNCINSGTLNASAVPNNFTYTAATSTSILSGPTATYYNLSLTSPSAVTKAIANNLTVLNNLTVGANVTFNWSNRNISVGGNWLNNANITCTNMATITFTGSGIQTISRTLTERFNNVTLAGSGTVQLNRDVNANGTTTLNSGTLDPTTFIYHQKGASWVGNGGLINQSAVGRVAFDGVVNQTIGGSAFTTFGNLEINVPGLSVTCLLDAIANGTTTLTSGTLNPGAFTFFQNGPSWLANGGDVSTAAAGVISFEGSAPQTIGGTLGNVFGNIQINGSSTVTLAIDLDVAGTFTILAGTFDVSASNFAVNLSGNFVHNGGTFNGRTGTVTFEGSTGQTASGSATTTFNNITSDNSFGGVSVTGIIIINGLLQVNNRSFGTSGIGNIILTATGATTYAKIGPLGPGASVTGTNWTIGAFINGPATAYWQYLGSPVSGSTIADWDNDNRFYMSAVGGNDGTACCPTFFSVRTYNNVTGSYVNVTSTSLALTPGRGFMVWMSDNMSQLVIPLPYDTRGTPNSGTVLRAVTAGGPGGGYNLVSNPYACPISYPAVVANSGNLNANFLILMENGSYTTNPNGGTIAPNQGFMAIATASGNMKFDEITKTVVANPNIIRAASPNYLRISASNSVNGLGGEAVVQINDEAHNGKDVALDMPFLASPYDDATNLWTSDKEGEELLLNALDGMQEKLDIPLTVKSGTPGEQLLAFKGLNGFTAYSCATLEDLATGEKINLKEHDTYSFQADVPGEKHEFILHFERDGNCPLNEQMIAPSLDASSQVFVNNGNILVKFGFEEKSNVVITVYNVAGQEVLAPKNMTVINETIALDSPGAHGIYMVRIVKGDEIVTKKIYY
ncbi:MAG: T9SS type A sorting domain-containing protein [Bacteroidota bacterium]|nr:T9SS type A sorting domain-containing protein [Bacteroidota bacterium]